MSQPAKLSANLVRPVAKGEAAPAAINPPNGGGGYGAPMAPPEAPRPAPTPEPPKPEPPPQAAPAPRQQAIEPRPAAPPTRPPAPEVPRQNLSVRLPVEMCEWLRGRAYWTRTSIQQIVEDAVSEYRERHPVE